VSPGSSFATRPTLRGFGGAVTAGHYLAAEAGHRALAEGGNAADAACTMGFALQVLEPHMNGPAGEVPILFYSASADRTYAISGQGVAPAGATIAAVQALGLDRIPGDGLLGATVPAALDAWCLLLERFGTFTLERALEPARALAGAGFPMYPFLRNVLRFLEPRFRSEWPTSAEVYLPVRAVGERQRNPRLAEWFGGLAAAERRARGGRDAGIRAARESFYRGRAAEQIERFAKRAVRDASGRAHAGLLAASDLARYSGSIEDPVSADYRGAIVWKCGPWSQGPVLLQQLSLLQGFDLASAGHNSADALHLVAECAKLAFADREACYGDPRFARVPLAELLSSEYARERRARVDRARASLEIRPGRGALPAGWPLLGGAPKVVAEPQAFAAARGRGDTTHLDAVDRLGNVVAATPSGAWIASSPLVPELGFPLGTRAQMFALDPVHPNALEPGKRPRTTLSPSLALLADGRRIAFGTPGGDQQDQWTLHLLLNLVDFGFDDLQAAIDAPTAHILHVPSSFWPRTAEPGVIEIEDRVGDAVIAELEARGHVVRRSGPWQHGRVMAVTRNDATGAVEAAASPRSQVAWAGVLP
jgi:gamma-glutamyltranspeptidase/glutathione hydrolase